MSQLRRRAVRQPEQESNIQLGTLLDVVGEQARILPVGGGSPITVSVPEHLLGTIEKGAQVAYGVVNGEYFLLSAYGHRSVEVLKANVSSQSNAVRITGGPGISVLTDPETNEIRISLDPTVPLSGVSHFRGLSTLTFAHNTTLVSEENGVSLKDGHLRSFTQNLDTGWHLSPEGEWRFLRRMTLSHGPDFTPDSLTWYGPSGIPMFRLTPTQVLIGLPFSEAYITVDIEQGLRIHGSAIEVGTLSAQALGADFVTALEDRLRTTPLRPGAQQAAFVSWGETWSWGAHNTTPAVLADAQAFRLGTHTPVRVTPDGRVSVPPETLVDGTIQALQILLGPALSLGAGGIQSRHPQRDWADRYHAYWNAKTGELFFATGNAWLDADGISLRTVSTPYARLNTVPEIRWYHSVWPTPATNIQLDTTGRWSLTHRMVLPFGGTYITGHVAIDDDFHIGNRAGNIVFSVPAGKEIIFRVGNQEFRPTALGAVATATPALTFWRDTQEQEPLLTFGRGEQEGQLDLRGGDTYLTTPGFFYVQATAFVPEKDSTALGHEDKRWKRVYAEELHVSTLVAQSVTATLGGQLIVAPTTRLSRSMDATTTFIFVEHAIFQDGDILYLEESGAREYLTVSGTATAGPGYFRYSVQRAGGGTTARAWRQGTAVVNTGKTGRGWLNLFAQTSMDGLATGPGLIVYARTANTPTSYAPRTALGRLSGIYHYDSAERYGAAFGNPAGFHITVDDENGIRFRQGTTTVAQWSTSGIWIGNAANLTGLGALAYKNTAHWSTDLSGIPTRFGETPSAPGLYATSAALGYWDGAQWRSYFDNVGNFFLQTGSGSGNYIGLSTTHATYRLWIGHSDPAQAPFRITKDGGTTLTNLTATGIFQWGGGYGVLNNTGFQWQVDTFNKVFIHADADTGYTSNKTYFYASGNLSNQYVAQIVNRATGDGLALSLTKLGSEGTGLVVSGPRWGIKALATYAAEAGRAAIYAISNSMVFYGTHITGNNGVGINLAMILSGAEARAINIRFGEGPYHSGATRGAAETGGHFLGFEGASASNNMNANLVHAYDVYGMELAGFARLYVDDDTNRITAGGYHLPVYRLTTTPRVVRLEDEFVGGGLAVYAVGELGWTYNAGSIQRPAAGVHRPGIIRRLSSTTAGEAASLFLGATNAPVFTQNAWRRLLWVAQFEHNNADFHARLGLASDPSSDTPAHGVYFERRNNDSQWYAVCRSSNAQTRVATNISFDTNWRRFAMVRKTSGIEFWLDGSLVATVTANIPADTTGLHPFIHVVPTGAVTRNYNVDRFEILLDSLER